MYLLLLPIFAKTVNEIEVTFTESFSFTLEKLNELNFFPDRISAEIFAQVF